jgi:hypothetical protein
MPVRVKAPTETMAARSKRALDKGTKAATMDTVSFWHKKYLPGHFELSANAKYDYQPRAGDGEPPLLPGVQVGKGNVAIRKRQMNWKYSWMKRRKKGHNRPLVFTGASEQAAEQSIRVSSRKVAAEEVIRGQGVMDLPKYFYQYRKDLNQPNKVDELLRTTADEVVDLHRTFESSLTAKMASPAASATPT